jgi:DNA replicative helicase MCM subunit Mcm2 (Cdc46/Mcm family)
VYYVKRRKIGLTSAYRRTRFKRPYCSRPLSSTFLEKYLQYARTFRPTISTEAIKILDKYWIKLQPDSHYHSKQGRDSLDRLIIATAMLKLKNVADEEDAQEVIDFCDEGDYQSTRPFIK